MKSIVSCWILCAYVLLASQPSASSGAPLKEDMVLYRHNDRYSAFPILYQDGDRLWVQFCWNMSRSHMDTGSQSRTGCVWLYSPDDGKTWLEHGKDDGYQSLPLRLGYLALSDGTTLAMKGRMHETVPPEKVEELIQRGVNVRKWPNGRATASYRVFISRIEPGESKPAQTILEPPFAQVGQFSSAGLGIVLPNDVVMGTIYGRVKTSDPASRVWAIRSEDKGKTWQFPVIAYDGVNSFDETALLPLPGGRIIALMRASRWDGKSYDVKMGNLWQTESTDGGKTWTPPRKTEIWGFPGTLIRLRNGDLLCSYGYRQAPYGVRACLSRDEGRTWDVANEVVLRSDGFIGKGKYHESRPPDHGYPVSVELSDGTIFTVYYITLRDGVTHIAATRWSPELAKGKGATAAN